MVKSIKVQNNRAEKKKNTTKRSDNELTKKDNTKDNNKDNKKENETYGKENYRK